MSNLCKYETRRLAATSLSGTATVIGAVTTGPVVKMAVLNTSDVSAYVTWDDNTIEVPAASTLTFDEQYQHNQQTSSKYIAPNATQFYGTQVTGAGASGHIILNLCIERTNP